MLDRVDSRHVLQHVHAHLPTCCCACCMRAMCACHVRVVCVQQTEPPGPKRTLRGPRFIIRDGISRMSRADSTDSRFPILRDGIYRDISFHAIANYFALNTVCCRSSFLNFK